jgi:hypothetical protein
MRIELHQFATNPAKIKRVIRSAGPIVLTENGVPVALVDLLIPASKELSDMIQKMIDSGRLQLAQQSGDVREWKYKRARKKSSM